MHCNIFWYSKPFDQEDTGGKWLLIIYTNTPKEIQVEKIKITRQTMVLVNFYGKIKHTIGENEFPARAERVNKYIRFCILEGPSCFNDILGHPWLHKIRVVLSIYHQVLNFSTKLGIKKIKGD